MKRKTYHEYTIEGYRLDYYDPLRTEGFYDMPVLKPCYTVPTKLIGFENMLHQKDKKQGIHFFSFDSRFEKIWKKPEIYIPKIKEFQCSLTPDFSMYRDMPLVQQMYNNYRAKLVGQMMQDEGIEVVPTIGFAWPSSYHFCFDGLPVGGVVAVSTLGIMNNDYIGQRLWREGVAEMIKRLRPCMILLYGKKIFSDFDYQGIPTKRYRDVLER